MTEQLRDGLERLAERVTDRPGAFEDLHRARERRNRRQARGALALGLAIAVLGTLTAFVAFRSDAVPVADGGDSTPAPPAATDPWQPAEALTIWPANPVSDGDGMSGAWQEDPKNVAVRFVKAVLAWDEPLVRESRAEVEAPWEARLFEVQPVCAPEYPCAPDRPLLVVVGQTDGMRWSVISVTSSPLSVSLRDAGDHPQVTLPMGGTLTFDLDLPDGVSAHIGIHARNGCSSTLASRPGLSSGRHVLDVPDAEPMEESCGQIGAGYAFVYVTDDTTVPVGDPLLEAAAIEYPWFTIVPLYVEMIDGPRASATPA